MVGLVVLAGGQSRRMGQDKARMAGGIRRILSEAKAAGLTPALCSQDLSRVARNSNERDGPPTPMWCWTIPHTPRACMTCWFTCSTAICLRWCWRRATRSPSTEWGLLNSQPCLKAFPWIHPAVAKCSSAAFRKGGWPRPMPSDGSRPCSMNSKTSTSNLPQAT